MQMTYSFRIYPSSEQEAVLLSWLDLGRKMYNLALEERQTVWKTEKRSIGYRDQQNKLPAFKKDNPEYKSIHSQVLQDVLRRVDTAYKNFFEKRAGFPRYKSKDRFTSITYPQVDKVSKTFSQMDKGYIYLPKIGYVKVRIHREFDYTSVGRINVKLKNKDWYVNITGEVPQVNSSPLPSVKSIGIDVGITSFVATSEGEMIDNPHYLEKKEKYIKRQQHRLSRKQLGSKNRQKAKKKLSKLHQQVSNQRRDFLHKTSSALVKQNDIIAAEDLMIKNMARNKRLAKSIHDASWGKLLTYINIRLKGKVSGSSKYRLMVHLRPVSAEPVSQKT